MNQKKCPKCGENNPPEAVMCWACYTPLSGGAVAPATVGPGGRGPGGAAALTADAGTGGGVAIPSWVYGGGGAVLVIALLVGAKVLLFSGGEEVLPPTNSSDQQINVSAPPSNYPPRNNTAPSAPGVSGPVAPTGPGGGGDPGPPATFVITPNGTFTRGVIGIIPKTAVGVTQAGQLGRWAASLYISRHTEIQVYVFADAQTADRFKTVQVGRRNAPLTADEFNSMGDVWANTPACVVVTRSSTRVFSPSSDANFWHNF